MSRRSKISRKSHGRSIRSGLSSRRRRSKSVSWRGGSDKKRPAFTVGQAVRWTWLGHPAYGKVFKIHYDKASVPGRDKEFKMKGTPTRPVYEIVQADGTHLLKSAMQLKKTTKKI